MSSISFPNPLNDEQISFMHERLGEPQAADGQTFLYAGDISANAALRNGRDLANVTQQPVTVELHADGEIKTMTDGTQYRVTRGGWRKVSNG